MIAWLIVMATFLFLLGGIGWVIGKAFESVFVKRKDPDEQ